MTEEIETMMLPMIKTLQKQIDLLKIKDDALVNEIEVLKIRHNALIRKFSELKTKVEEI